MFNTDSILHLRIRTIYYTIPENETKSLIFVGMSSLILSKTSKVKKYE